MSMQRSSFYTVLILLLALPYLGRAQSGTTLSGKVIDEGGHRISEVYIELFAKEKPQPITVTLTDSIGAFRASCDEEVDYIRLQHISYEPLILHAPFPTPLFVAMQSRSEELAEVVVTGRKAPSKVTANGLNFTPTEIQKKLPNLTLYLAQLPFVEKIGNQYGVTGRGKAEIYIDNRKIDDHDELKDLKMEDISSIDVLTNPGAVYGANVHSVIKIHTKRKQSGLGIDVNGGLNYDNGLEFWSGGGIEFNTPTFSIRSSVNYDYDPNKAHLIIEQLMGKDRTTSAKYNTTEQQLFKYLVWRNNLVYAPNSHHTMGLRVHYTGASWKTDVVNNLDYKDPHTHTTYTQSSTSQSPHKSLMCNAFYNYTDKVFDLLLNADFYRGKESNTLSSSSSNTTPDQNINTSFNIGNILGYFQALGRYNFSKAFTGELGADFSYTSVDQKYDIDRETPNLTAIDIQTNQRRYAGYAALSYAIEPWTFRAGLRHEALRIDRRERKDNHTYKLFSRSRLYPTVSVLYDKNAFQGQLSYSMKTEYPAYNQLRAGVNYSSPYLYEGGNPNLIPETRHDISFIGRYRKSSIILNYTHVLDEIIQVPSLYTDNIMLYRPENHGPNRYLSVILSQRLNFKKLLESNLQASYRSQWINIPGFPIGYGDGYMFRIDNAIHLNSHIQFFVNAAYHTRSKQSLYQIPAMWHLDLGMNVSMLSDRLNLYVGCSDVFSTMHAKRSFSRDNLAMHYNRDYETRLFSLTFSYKFQSAVQGKEYKGNATNSEIQRL